MRYLSICSGIEAATVAWHPLGWEPAAFSEIDARPREILAHHYPNVPIHGDFTTIGAEDYGPIDILVGGTPCQSFSIAGLRGGLDDDRGNLALEFLRLADRKRPRWLVWENVPGVLSSNGGRDFGSILGGMVELGYGFAYRVLDAQYIRVDGYARAVPQRRRRVFLVGYLGDWRRAAAVLFERESLSRHPRPRREARQDVAPTISARTRGGGGLGTDFECDGGLIPFQGRGTNLEVNSDVAGTLGTAIDRASGAAPCIAHTLNAKGGAGRVDAESETFVAHALRAEGFDASEDGTGRGTPLIAEVAGTIGHNRKAAGSATSQDAEVGLLVAFNGRQDTDCYHGHTGPIDTDEGTQCIAIQERAVSENPEAGPDGAVVAKAGASYTLEARTVPQSVQHGWAVRRLTPVECERLQGFPDNYTAVPTGRARTIDADVAAYMRSHGLEVWVDNRGRHRTNIMADGPRYKALGNSMAVNVMRWIGRRIEMCQ